MNEILDGIFHWTAFHEGIRMDVSSYYVTANGAATLIDPLTPEEGIDWFREREAPQRIVLTNRHHYRHSDRFSDAFGCPVVCQRDGLHEFAGGPEVQGFDFGDELAPGVRALEVRAICNEETALHIDAGGGTLAVADGVIRYGDLMFVPDQYLGDDPEGVKRGLREAYRGLIDQDFDNLLFAHGEPLVGGGKDALRRFVEGG